jgi:hypothetical protein
MTPGKSRTEQNRRDLRYETARLSDVRSVSMHERYRVKGIRALA